MNKLVNTGEMCMISVVDENREDGFRMVDIGNYFQKSDGTKVVITSGIKAEKYGHLIDADIYVRKL